jgi:hypothetical protein
VECLQDIEIQMRLFRQFRTTEITEEEIQIWRAVYFGIDRVKPEEFSNDLEAVTWREILCGTGPAHRCPILTEEITDQEITEWREDYEKLEKINFEEVRKRYNVKFERDEYYEPPYQECDWTNTSWNRTRRPVQWPAESTIFPWIEEAFPGVILDENKRHGPNHRDGYRA